MTEKEKDEMREAESEFRRVVTEDQALGMFEKALATVCSVEATEAERQTMMAYAGVRYLATAMQASETKKQAIRIVGALSASLAGMVSETPDERFGATLRPGVTVKRDRCKDEEGGEG